MVSNIVTLLIAIVSYFLKNHETTSKAQKKLDKMVDENRHLLSENTKQKIASETKNVNEKIDTAINDINHTDSLQQSNDIINKTINNKK